MVRGQPHQVCHCAEVDDAPPPNEGEITVAGEKTATAEEIKLTFDFYPTIQGASQEALDSVEKASSSSHGNGTNGKDGKGSPSGHSRLPPDKSTSIILGKSSS